MTTIATFAALFAAALPVLLLVGLALRGSGGIQLTPIETILVAVAVTWTALVRVVFGAITLDHPFLAPILFALPIAAGMHFGPRTGSVTAVGTWMVVGVLALGNGVLDEAGDVGGSFVACAGAAVFAGFYAGFLGAWRRSMSLVACGFAFVPALAHPSGPIADPVVILGALATVPWALLLDRGIGWIGREFEDTRVPEEVRARVRSFEDGDPGAAWDRA